MPAASATSSRQRRPSVATAASVQPASQPGDNLPVAEGQETVQVSPDPHAGHAILHDFCMCIPYGLILGFSGLVCLLFRAFSVGLPLLAACSAIEFSAVRSIKKWKAGGQSRFATVASAVVAAWTGWRVWQLNGSGVAALAANGLVGLSAVMCLFLVYNLAAGGNPPKHEGAGSKSAEEVVEIPLSPQT